MQSNAERSGDAVSLASQPAPIEKNLTHDYNAFPLFDRQCIVKALTLRARGITRLAFRPPQNFHCLNRNKSPLPHSVAQVASISNAPVNANALMPTTVPRHSNGAFILHCPPKGISDDLF
jgi:hypothetical protein